MNTGTDLFNSQQKEKKRKGSGLTFLHKPVMLHMWPDLYESNMQVRYIMSPQGVTGEKKSSAVQTLACTL
jgi:hypothetical protein